LENYRYGCHTGKPLLLCFIYAFKAVVYFDASVALHHTTRCHIQ